jgi:hypothetical protein
MKEPNIITDRYDRKGKLENIGDLYVFSPLEIKNDNLKTYDRINPILNKNEEVELTYSIDNNEIEELNENNDDDYNIFLKNIQNLKDKINTTMNSIIKENESLKDIYNDKIFEIIIIKMFYEKLSIKEKINVINFKGNNILHSILNDYIINIDNDKLIVAGINKNDMIILKQTNKIWEITEDNSYYKSKIKEIANTFQKQKSKPYYGIIGYDNNYKSIFKIKNVNKGDSKGKNCLSAKDDYKIILELLLNIKYDKLTKLVKLSKDYICKFIEFLFRYQNIIDEKTWLLEYHKYIILDLLK